MDKWNNELPDSITGEVADAANELIIFILTDAAILARDLVTQLCNTTILSALMCIVSR